MGSMWGHQGLFEAFGRSGHAGGQKQRHAPLQVIDGNYQKMTGVCPWWERQCAGTDRSDPITGAEEGGVIVHRHVAERVTTVLRTGSCDFAPLLQSNSQSSSKDNR